MKRIIFPLLLILSTCTFSQNTVIDSLTKVQSNQTGENRVKSLIELVKLYEKSSQDKAIEYAQIILDIAKENNNLKQQTFALNAMGTANIRKGSFENGIKYHQQAIEIYTELKNDTGLAKQYGNIGVAYDMLGEYQLAIENYQKSLALFDKINDNKSVAFVENNIGVVYEELSNFEKAIEYYNKALQTKKNNKDSIGMASTLNNLGVVHEKQQKYDKAISYYQAAYEIYKNKKIINREGTALNNIGLIYLATNQYKKALQYFEEALKLRKEAGDEQGQASTLLNIGNTYLKEQNSTQAEKYFLESLNLFIKTKNKTKLIDVYKCLADLENKKGNYKEAFKYLNNYSLYKDSVLNEKSQEKIAELQTKYETQKKEQELEILSKDNLLKNAALSRNKWIIALLSGLFLMVLALGFMFFRQRQLKAREKQISTEQKLLRSQMNPHFVFNSLAALQNLIIDEKTNEASSYVSKFAKLLRLILENSCHEYVLLEKEISTLENYIQIQQMRFENAFNYKIQIDETIDPETISIPPMLAQPFVENTIEHGLIKKDKKGFISIHFIMENDVMKVKIEDNGIGINKAKEMKISKGTDHQSLALSITEERLKNLKKSKNQNIFIKDISEITSNKNGTQIIFEIPYQLL